MATKNTDKTPPKGSVKFSLTLSAEQKIAKSNILHAPFSFVIGKAGSGKTLLACQIALDKFFKREVDKIVITRPTVATEDIGFLPGSCIVDEFQNLTKQQLLMVLGRLGKGSIMIFCGDKDQIDLKFANDSAVHEVPKLRGSKYVYEVMLKDNHRHAALDEIFDLLK